VAGIVACRGEIRCDRGRLVACQSSGGRINVVFGASDSVAPSQVKRLVELVRETDSLRRFPRRYIGSRPITISLIARERQGIEAAAYGEERTIVLPLEAALAWRTEDLRSLLRHELTHIALAGGRTSFQLPKWFQEGFAEWTAGGLTCQGAARIRVNMLLRPEFLKDTSMFKEPAFAASRVGYDVFSTFFEFLEERSTGVNLSLLDSLDAYGLENGIRRATRADLPTLQREWRIYAMRRYSDLREQQACQSRPIPSTR